MRRPKTARLLLAAVATMLLSGTLWRTVAAERHRDTTDEDGSGGEKSYEFEEKILRAWLEKYIDKYKKYSQLPTGSTNIQRIAKKSETSTFKMPMLDHEYIVALSMFPFLVNPFYQPLIYSRYIPLPYDATTRLIPVGQIPYQKEKYHHRFLGPLQTQFPIGYKNIQGIMSSTLINNEPEIKETMNVPNFIPPDNQGVKKKIDNELYIPEQISNQNQDGFDHTSPIEPYPEEPMKIDQKKVDINEQQNSKDDQKPLDQIIEDDLTNTVTTDQNQMSESHEIQDLQPTTTTGDFNTSMTLNTTNFTETYQTSTVPSSNISNDTSKSEIYSNSVSQLLLSSDYHLLKHINSSDHPTTRESSFLSNVKKLETSVKSTFSSTANDKSQEVTPTSEERSRPDESQKFHYYSKDKHTTGILKAPIINIGEISTETTRTTRNSKLMNTFSTPPSTTKITLFSTPFCENNDCKITTSSLVNTSLAKQVTNNQLQVTVTDFKNTKSTNQKFTKIINGQHNVTDLNNSSTRPSTIPITTSETSTLPYTKTYSTNILTSSQPHPKYFSSTKSPRANYITDENNKIHPTSLRYTSLLPPMIQPLNINNIITSVLVESKTEQTPPITTNSNKCTNSIKQNTNIPRHDDDSTRSYSTSPDINMYSNSYQSQKIPTATKKSNTYKNDNINTYLSVTTERTKGSTFKPTVTPIKQYKSVQKKLPIITVSDDSKFDKTTYNQETLNTPRSTEDSELWYNHMYPQNPLKKEPNEEQIHNLLKKIVKLLKPEIEKQTITKESVARLVPPRLGDPEKFVYIIYPWVIDAAKNMENEKRTRTNANLFTTPDMLK